MSRWSGKAWTGVPLWWAVMVTACDPGSDRDAEPAFDGAAGVRSGGAEKVGLDPRRSSSETNVEVLEQFANPCDASLCGVSYNLAPNGSVGALAAGRRIDERLMLALERRISERDARAAIRGRAMAAMH